MLYVLAALAALIAVVLVRTIRFKAVDEERPEILLHLTVRRQSIICADWSCAGP